MARAILLSAVIRSPWIRSRANRKIKDGDVLLTHLGLLCQGKPAYNNVRETLDDPDFYESALGITQSIPSSEPLRQRMNDIGSSIRLRVLEANMDDYRAKYLISL